MGEPIRVVVADDHPVFRTGLRTLVRESPSLELAGAAADGAQAVELCLAERPDVVLMDIRMPGTSGVEATRRLRADAPEIAVLALTMLEDDATVVAVLRAGARGYILKGAAPDDILRAITAVAAGEVIIGKAVADRLAALVATSPAPHPFPQLTARERDILDILAAGRGNAEIARRLGLSEKTVRNNVSTVMAKLGVTDRPAAIVLAREAGLATPPTRRTP